MDNLKAKMVLKYTNFKNYAKAHWLVSLVVISVLIMLAIHILYKIPAPISFLTAEWGAGDVLSFAGAIIGAIATIYVLQETISSTVSMQKEQRISSFRPYFVVEAIASHEIEGRVIALTNGTGNMTWIGNISGALYLQNVGAGNAIVEQITFSCGKPKAADYQECVYKTIPALLVGEKNVILLRKCTPGTLSFQMIFSDMEKLGRYCATTEIHIVSNAGKDFLKCDVLNIQEIGGK